MNIAVVAGARVQYALAMESAQVIADAMIERGHHVWVVVVEDEDWFLEQREGRVPVDRSNFTFPHDGRRIRPDFVFLAVHDDFGKGPLQGELDLLGIPYDSSGKAVSLICDDKAETKARLEGSGIELARGIVYQAHSPIPESQVLESVGLPCFVKPNCGGSAIGTGRVSNPQELGPALQEALRWNESVLVESFVPGREVTCGVVGLHSKTVTLPLTEYLLDGNCKTWEGNQGTVPKQTPANLSEALVLQIENAARKAYDILGCRGLTRVDFRLDARHNLAPYFLEINTLPGLERRGAMITQVLKAGLDVGEVFETLMHQSLAEKSSSQV